MLYVPVLEFVPDDFEVKEDGGLHAVSIGLARTADSQKFVSVDVEVGPIEWGGEPAHELSFSINVVSIDGSDESFETQDRTMAIGYIPDEVRPLIMPSVCAAVSKLVEFVSPIIVYRVTKSRHPPDKALYKHHLITDTLLGHGYELVDTGTDALGRTFWVLTK